MPGGEGAMLNRVVGEVPSQRCPLGLYLLAEMVLLRFPNG